MVESPSRPHRRCKWKIETVDKSLRLVAVHVENTDITQLAGNDPNINIAAVPFSDLCISGLVSLIGFPRQHCLRHATGNRYNREAQIG